MVRILLVEDNEGDILLAKEVLEELNFPHSISVARDGKEALDMLLSKNSTSLLPDLILLDMNLPLKNGLEVLKEIKSSRRCQHIPVVVFSTSSSQKDVNMAYEFHANSFISKPAEPEDLSRIFKTFVDYWVNIVLLSKGN